MNLRLPSDRVMTTCAELARAAAASPRLAVLGAGGGASGLVLRALARETRAPLVAITADLDGAHALRSDLRFYGLPSLLFDPGEQSPYAELVPDRRAAQHRLATLFRLARLEVGDEAAPIVVIPAAALTRRVVPAWRVLDQSVLLRAGE